MLKVMHDMTSPTFVHKIGFIPDFLFAVSMVCITVDAEKRKSEIEQK